MKNIKIEDLLKFRFIENLSFSPDEKKYAFQMASIDKEKDSYFRTVYVNKKAYPSDKSTSFMGWYDDRQLIIAEENKNKKAVFNKYSLLDVESGKRKVFLTTALNISKFEVLDANTLVLRAGIDANDPDLYKDSKEKLEKKKTELKKEADYEVLDEIPYWFNGAGFTNKKRQALFVCTLKPFTMERITDPYFSPGPVKVKDKKIYFSGNSYKTKRPLFDKVYVYDIATKTTEALYDKEDFNINAIEFLNDELYIAGTDGKQYGINETSKFYILKDKELKPLKSPDRSLYDSVATDVLLGSGKGSVVKDDQLFTLASEKDHVEIWQLDKNIKIKKLLSMPLINFFDVGKDRIIFSACDEDKLQELYEYSFKNKKIRQISSFNKNVLKDRYVAKPQELKYKSNGVELNGWVLLPKDYDKKKKYPAVLDVHGGPRAMYTKAYFHEMQVWANRGYFVMFTNIHGSDGRGDEFADIRGKYGYVDFEDLMNFVDAVLTKYPAIDKDRLCETGGSYGGFMTNWIIGHTDRFCCTASQRSIANWPGFTYLSDIGFYFATDQNGISDPIKDYDKLWEHSPLKYVDNAKTPTLFIHSDQDYRCPLPEGMQMMQALCERGVETRLVLFHGENHELSRSGKPSHRIRRLKEISEWFDKHCF
ncbi:MAG: S9 family peptidase [Erysipelotrichaceae bacterium]|nr:S9 family peptidase [Erysipelotrichaceae bacterium]